MTSQGQRFRRRALRRGYKVDEVDAFLDRVEGTLAGDSVGAPVAAQEVHDVVFRVRFGGYDEWQVDLHLDRVERQLGEYEERAGGFGRPAEPRMPPSERGRPPMSERPMPPMSERPMPPMPERPMPARPGPPMPVQAGPPGPGYGRYDEPGHAVGGFEDLGTFDAFGPGRHGRADMTAEIRMPEREQMGPPPGPGPAPGMGAPPGRGPAAGMAGPHVAGPPPGGPPTGAPGGGPAGELQRIDQIRRTFQLRRFGSGYDPGQVDRLFEDIMAVVSSHGPAAISDADLDSSQFSLVAGGYFEAEVDAALKEVRDILRRH